MKKGSVFCLVVLFLLWILLLPLYAKEFHVSCSEEFQDALYEAAFNGESDSIYLAAGTYKGNFYFEPSEEELSAEWISLEIYGQKGTVIEGSLSFDNIVTWQPSSGIGYYINLESFKIIGGITVSGFGSANFSNLKVENGSIYFESAIPEYGVFYPYGERGVGISNCEIFNSNSSAINIGAFGEYFSVYIARNVIKDNNGNGITISGWPSGNIFIEHNTIENNQGNGISIDGALYIEISNNKIRFNKSSGIKIEESGLFSYPGCYGDFWDCPGIYIYNNLVAYNSADQGGGIQLCGCQAFPTAVIQNIIIKNKAQTGGGVYVNECPTIFIYNTIIANTANQNGGGIAATNNSFIEYFNNIVWGNEALNIAADIYHTENTYCEYLFNNDYHDFIGKCQIHSSNIDANPLFIDLNNDDYHLSSNSPCIDAGTSEIWIFAGPLPKSDFEGNNRIIGFAPDIGAYESQVYPANNPPTITSIFQYQSDGTQIPEGGIIPEGTIVFKATVEDPDGDDVRLEIELREIDEPFTGEPTPETISDFVPSGSEVTITRSGLVDGDYHWQYRVKDSKGAVSEWKEFGKAGNVDFKVVVYLHAGDYVVIDTGEGLNLRDGIGLDSEIKVALPDGCLGKVMSDPDNGTVKDGYAWWKVKFGENEGWCAEGENGKKWLKKPKVIVYIENVPYIHQVKDTEACGDGFNGGWACGATCSVMLLGYYKKLPTSEKELSCYICEKYSYNNHSFDTGTLDPSENCAYGAYGFIHRYFGKEEHQTCIDEDAQFLEINKAEYGTAKWKYIESFLQKHGLEAKRYSDYSDKMIQNIVKEAIYLGRPVILGSHCLWKTTNKEGQLVCVGHIILVKGLMEIDGKEKYIVNDPWPYKCRDQKCIQNKVGEDMTYSWEEMLTKGLVVAYESPSATTTKGDIEIQILPLATLGNLPLEVKPLMAFNTTVSNLDPGDDVTICVDLKTKPASNIHIYKIVDNKHKEITEDVTWQGTGFCYSARDGGELDADKQTNGIIEDPIVLAQHIKAANRYPYEPFGIKPGNGSKNVSYERVTFSWQSGDPDGDDLKYKFVLSLAENGKCDFQTPILSIETHNKEYLVTNLSPSSEYCWQVIACDSYENCSLSQVFFFSTKAIPGDLDKDNDVDRDDLNILLSERGKKVNESTCGEACDLDQDGIITVIDARKLVLMCTRPRCAVE